MNLEANLALVLRGPLLELDRVLRALSRDPDVQLVYRKLSAARLRVIEETPGPPKPEAEAPA